MSAQPLRVGQLIDALRKANPDARVVVAHFRGPGSPEADTLVADHVRNFGRWVWICGDDQCCHDGTPQYAEVIVHVDGEAIS